MPDDYYKYLEVGGVRSLKNIISLGAYWRDVRMEFSPDGLIYRGANYFHNAETSDTNWEIWKYSHSGGNMVRIEGPLPGSWDNRATLDWG
jgi:hypothetical protein